MQHWRHSTLKMKNPSILKRKTKIELGKQAVWSLSTAKPGNGVQQLRDNRLDTFWQYEKC